jgi:hypothetical protein
MRKLAHFAFAAAVMASAVTGAATVFPTSAAAQEQPWATVTYFSGGRPVGTAEWYCSGDVIYNGQTTNYDYETYAYHFMCP